MKNILIIFIAVFAFLVSANDAHSQSRLRALCPDRVTLESITLENATGDIRHRPCAGRTNIFTERYGLERTITAIGTTGAQTINRMAGTVNFAAAATSVVVTNNQVTADSLIFLTVRTIDGTCTTARVVAGAGSFTITVNAACTATTSIGFFVTN